LTVDEYKSKLQQSEFIISILKKLFEANDEILQSKNVELIQMQGTIEDLKRTEETSNRTIQELREKQTQLQASNNDLKKTVESLKQAVHLPSEQPKKVSTYDVQGVTTSKCSAVPPGINIFKILPNDDI
jgi:chromosome segregation ATPase